MIQGEKSAILKNLQADILRMQGFKATQGAALQLGLGPMLKSFPDQSFPAAAVHECLCERREDLAVTSGFVTAIISLLNTTGAVIWVSSARKLFAPALKSFGVDPERFIFIDVKKSKETGTVVEEALKCEALAAVVGELPEMDFTQSRRFQLAVEASGVTGFILRTEPRKIQASACFSRWRITHIPSEPMGKVPGIGFPKWNVELLKVKNGKPGAWTIYWMDHQFVFTPTAVQEITQPWIEKKAG